MSSHKTARVARVLSGALRVWGVSAGVEVDSNGLEVRTPSGARLQISPAAPHGWLVFRDARLLAMHAGLPGLLRTIRDEL
jgi:hypothetical protein